VWAAIEELRRLVAAAPAPRRELRPYLDRVRTRAYTIEDADIDGLKSAGISEDEIFEATVAVAVSEGLRRLDTALGVIG
jgi:alkylhydroperoxidase family enzyme